MTGRRAVSSLRLCLVVVVAVSCAILGWIYIAHDSEELSCGVANLFEKDYTRHISDLTSFEDDRSGRSIDFRKLDLWQFVCFTSPYGGASHEFNLSVADLKEKILPLPIKRWVGRSRCARTDTREVRILLMTADSEALLTKLMLPSEWSQKNQNETNYSSFELPNGFRQCSPTRDAIAHCVPLGSNKESSCIWMFTRSDPRG